MNIVHVGEATLAKRVKEFALTTSGDLTVEEFEAEIKELEAQTKKELQLNTIGAPAPAHIHGGCPHLGPPSCQWFPNCYTQMLLSTSDVFLPN